MIRRGLALLFLLAAAPAYAQLPPRLAITYDVLRNGSAVAEIVGSFQQADGNYQLVETWRGRGIYALLGRAKRTSVGRLISGGVQPREYTDERSGRDTAQASFDWNAKTATFRYRGKTRTEPMHPNPQDRLSFILALALAPAGSKTGDYHLVDGRGVSHHINEFAGRERVPTPVGEFDAVKVERGKDDDRLEIWLATEFGGLPVRSVGVDKGTRWDQVATRIER